MACWRQKGLHRAARKTYVSAQSWGLTTALKWYRSTPCQLSRLYEAKCLHVEVARSQNGCGPCTPVTKRIAYRDVRKGSSPGVSCNLPHLGSRTMLICPEGWPRTARESPLPPLWINAHATAAQ